MSQQLANGKQQFIDGNGNPLAGGSVAFYLPGTLTPTNTWQDPGLTTLNANPVILDANGMASIWGADSTQYRQVVDNSLGEQIWDQVVGMSFSSTFGTSAQRPTANLFVGKMYFDTTLGQPIWCSSISPIVWVNSAGVSV